jgi:predicted nucleic acid-binding protein
LISIDSYGWMERLAIGPKASQYNKIIDTTEQEEIVTSVVTLYEVYKRLKLAKGEESALEGVAVLSQTQVIAIDQPLSLEAADYSLEHGLHMSDALIYATARHKDADLYTSDDHLKGLKGVVFV